MAFPHKAPPVRRHKMSVANAAIKQSKDCAAIYLTLLQLLSEAQIPRIAQTGNNILVRVENGIDGCNPKVNICGVSVLQDIIYTLGATKH